MSKLKDTPQTKKAKEQYNNPIVYILFANEPLTKEEIGDKLHVSSDRQIREIIAECSMHYPIIATSNRKGYRRAKDIATLEGEALEAEIEEIEHQINEHKNRIKCLRKKMKPLIAWLSVAKKKRDENKND